MLLLVVMLPLDSDSVAASAVSRNKAQSWHLICMVRNIAKLIMTWLSMESGDDTLLSTTHVQTTDTDSVSM